MAERQDSSDIVVGERVANAQPTIVGVPDGHFSFRLDLAVDAELDEGADPDQSDIENIQRRIRQRFPDLAFIGSVAERDGAIDRSSNNVPLPRENGMPMVATTRIGAKTGLT